MNPRVRFAPSPTGPLHIGGLRTALFNYLFARKHKGVFILRIEDTDQNRFVEGAEAYIVNSLNWCGIEPDESPKKGGDFAPYRQSERQKIYQKYVLSLLETENAYYAFDTPEELDLLRKEAESQGKNFIYDAKSRNKLKNSTNLSTQEVEKLIRSGIPYVVRFRIPENETLLFSDLIRGNMEVNTNTLDDKVLFKSDGLPTYHLANVVDDYLMKISHVIRGEEWLPSLPLHVLLYKAFGWEDQMPEFAHLPLILKPTGKGKLSKRDGEKLRFPVFPLEWKDPKTEEIFASYRENGYLSETLINMLALLGWNPGTDQEIFSLNELIEEFSLDGINKSGARFDPEKVKWFNHQYLMQKTDAEVAMVFNEILEKKGYSQHINYVTKVCSLVRERVDFVSEIWDQASYFFLAPKEFNPKALKKTNREDTLVILQQVTAILQEIEQFDTQTVEREIKDWIAGKEIGFGKVMMPLRLSVVGELKGPHLFDIISLLGKKEVLQRIRFFLQILN